MGDYSTTITITPIASNSFFGSLTGYLFPSYAKNRIDFFMNGAVYFKVNSEVVKSDGSIDFEITGVDADSVNNEMSDITAEIAQYGNVNNAVPQAVSSAAQDVTASAKAIVTQTGTAISDTFLSGLKSLAPALFWIALIGLGLAFAYFFVQKKALQS